MRSLINLIIFSLVLGQNYLKKIQPMNDHTHDLGNLTESKLIVTSVEEQHVLTITNSYMCNNLLKSYLTDRISIR